MKMARATEEDVKVLREFLQWLENYSEDGSDSRGEFDEDSYSYPAIDDEAALEFIRRQFSRFCRTRNVGMARVHSLMQQNGSGLVDESLEDSIRDLQGYCLLWLACPIDGVESL